MKDVFLSESKIPAIADQYRPRQHAAVWRVEQPDWRDRLTKAIQHGLGNHSISIFFRADDIGAGGRAFETLCQLFRHYDIPLGMGVVPAWLSATRQDQLFSVAPLQEPLWGWHQHGWRHVNWQRTGKKSEFGEQRPFEKQWRDIWQGRQKMTGIFGEYLVSVFTPPWNRLSNSTIRVLHELDFKGISMEGPTPRGLKLPNNMKNLRVQLDLHTRKPKDGNLDFEHLLAELSSLLGRKEPGGIMIHHQRMTAFAFQFLEEILRILKSHIQIRFLSFHEILKQTQ